MSSFNNYRGRTHLNMAINNHQNKIHTKLLNKQFKPITDFRANYDSTQKLPSLSPLSIYQDYHQLDTTGLKQYQTIDPTKTL